MKIEQSRGGAPVIVHASSLEEGLDLYPEIRGVIYHEVFRLADRLFVGELAIGPDGTIRWHSAPPVEAWPARRGDELTDITPRHEASILRRAKKALKAFSPRW